MTINFSEWAQQRCPATRLALVDHLAIFIQDAVHGEELPLCCFSRVRLGAPYVSLRVTVGAYSTIL